MILHWCWNQVIEGNRRQLGILVCMFPEETYFLQSWKKNWSKIEWNEAWVESEVWDECRCESDSGSTQWINLDWSAIMHRENLSNIWNVQFQASWFPCESTCYLWKHPEDFVQSANIQAIVWSLQYLSTKSRPDTAFAVSNAGLTPLKIIGL